MDNHSIANETTNSAESTEAQSIVINPDHLNATNEQLESALRTLTTPVPPDLPPLATVETSTERRKKGNRKAFKAKNTTRHDSVELKKLNVGEKGKVQHPVNMIYFSDILTKGTQRRIQLDCPMETSFRSKMIDFLKDKAGMNCFSPRHNKKNNCTCLKDLLERDSDNNINAVADIVTAYYQLGHKERSSLLCNKVFEVMDRKINPRLKTMSSMKFRGTLFSIRGKFGMGNNDANVDTHLLCMYSYLLIYGHGVYQLESIKKKYEKSCYNTERNMAHGLTGRRSNHGLNPSVLQSLSEFFNALKDEGDDYASKQVRTSAGQLYLRDNELDGVRLPPSYSKKMLYDRWCFNQGWVIGRGSDAHKGYKSFRQRNFDDNDFPPGSFPSPICSRETFMTYWKKNFSSIKIAPAAKDTCAKCWEYKRQIQSQDRRSIAAAASVEDEANDEHGNNDQLPECPTEGLERSNIHDLIDNALINDSIMDDLNDDNMTTTDASASTSMVSLQPMMPNTNSDNSNEHVELYSPNSSTIRNFSTSQLNSQVVEASIDSLTESTTQEQTVSIWKQHCDEFTAQRRYVQQLALESKLDFQSNVPWNEKRISYCSDYCQNIDLPHFGCEQPGETYYYSPLIVNCFGCTDLATDILDAFIYNEGEGRKGGNNVCSLIYKKLKDDGIIDKSKMMGPAKKLSLVFDNCAGQNKNRMVLRLGQYLIDTEIFKRVEIIFLIMGHTKNICDRRFKDLKNKFHHRNVYTMQQLVNTLSEGNEQYVDVIPVNRNVFYNWDDFFTKTLCYKKAIKDCSKYHCFFYDEIQKGKIFKKHTVLNQILTKEAIHKQADNKEWKDQLKEALPSIDKAPGIADIKQVELYTKWRKLIPDQYQDIICPKPDDHIIIKVKRDKAKRAKNKLEVKKKQLESQNK